LPLGARADRDLLSIVVRSIHGRFGASTVRHGRLRDQVSWV